jgi:xylose isomerase
MTMISRRARPMVFGAGLWMFGQFIDRYATDAYGPPVGTLKAIERAGTVGKLSVVDINFPFEPGVSVEDVRGALERAALRAIAVTPAIYTRQFQRGAFTNPDAEIRRSALALAHDAAAVARELGARYVKFWPGQDGYDYPLQSDYVALWDLTVEGIRAVAAAHPDMQFAIEYKAREPRNRMTLSTASRTLLAIEDMGVDNVGVVMDLGHSIMARETPAEELQLLARRGRLTSVEVNDNWGEWDDDLTVGAVHLLHTVDFLLALRKIDWQAPILLDQFPFREDPVGAARNSIDLLKHLDSRLDELDVNEFRACQARQDALAAQRLVQTLLLGMKTGA